MRKVLLALGALLVLLGVGFALITSGLSDVMALPMDGVSLKDKPDGDYTGTYAFKRWTNTLTVHVADHRITGIDIVDDVGAAFITHCSGELFQRVIAAQDTRVDAVSGATVTSKAYLKAIENALS